MLLMGDNHTQNACTEINISLLKAY